MLAFVKKKKKKKKNTASMIKIKIWNFRIVSLNTRDFEHQG